MDEAPHYMTSLSALPACRPTHNSSSIRLAVQTWPESETTAEPSEPTLDKAILAPILMRWLLPAVLLVGATVLLTQFGLDIALARLFYTGTVCIDDWAGPYREPWHALYRLGPIPGLALGIAGAVVGIGSFVIPRWQRYRSAGLFLAVLLALGPGMLVNGLLKPKWGRPRPCQIVEFGGEQTYLPCWKSGIDTDSRSFPSGHASMGFYLMAPAFLLHRSHRRAALGFVVLGLFVGGSIGVARVVQGKHFPSDVLWSLGCVYFSGLVLSVAFQRALQWSVAAQQQPPVTLLSIAATASNTAGAAAAEDQGTRRFPATISIEEARTAQTRAGRQQQPTPVPLRRAA